jgi:protein tyrosine phosphatase (PTP) superfamily phosphohydrolase (DUF442 family)
MCTSAVRCRLLALVLLAMLVSPGRADEAVQSRPKQWAEPITLEGVPNLHKVSDTLYRSAQPTAVGMESLKRLGIKTVVNLRSFHSDQTLLGNTGLALEAIPMNTWDISPKEAAQFLRIATDPKRAPVLVHCQHGADRTGTMCATYRIAVQGWTKKDAIREMTEGGFGFHSIWRNLIRWVEKLDVAQVCREAGLPEPAKNDQSQAQPAPAADAK